MLTRLLPAFFLFAIAVPDAKANDFPTVERVLYVQECMRDNPGPNFEMVNKCACALDVLAREIDFASYESMSTITKAITIGGERGGELRDNETIKPQIQKLRAVQTKARQACFMKSK